MFNISGLGQSKQRFYFHRMMILIIEILNALFVNKYNSSKYLHAREITYNPLVAASEKNENRRSFCNLSNKQVGTRFVAEDAHIAGE